MKDKLNSKHCYVFSKTGTKDLEKFLLRAPTLIAFDYDGTLAPIVRDPMRAFMTEKVKNMLFALLEHGPVLIISGRSIKNLIKFGLGDFPMIGNHGLDFFKISDNREAKQFVSSWSKKLKREVAKIDSGIFVENKVVSLSVHFREAKNSTQAKQRIWNLCSELGKAKLIEGKSVLNVLPPQASDKGEALLKAMKKLKLKQSVFVGDDITDEYVFRLNSPNVFSICVGQRKNTAAPYFVERQAQVQRLLKMIDDIQTARRTQ